MHNQNRLSTGMAKLEVTMDSAVQAAVPEVIMRVATAGSVLTMKVGDKVSQVAYTEGDEGASFFRVKHVDQASNVFATDPNGPFDRSWKGRITDWKPHPLYAGYWVKAGQTMKSRLAAKAKADVVSVYELALNWYGETFKVKVKARSTAQAMTAAASKLAASELKAFTAWHVLQYMKNNDTRVSVKPI